MIGPILGFTCSLRDWFELDRDMRYTLRGKAEAANIAATYKQYLEKKRKDDEIKARKEKDIRDAADRQMWQKWHEQRRQERENPTPEQIASQEKRKADRDFDRRMENYGPGSVDF